MVSVIANPVSSENSQACLHCGSAFAPGRVGEQFCCHGCEYVYRLIACERLDQFYELRNRSLPPVQSAVFQKSDLEWLEQSCEKSEVAAREESQEARIALDVQGISCIGCVWIIERLFGRREGAVQIGIQPQLGRMQLVWTPGIFDPLDFCREIQKFGYRVGPAREEPSDETRLLSGKLALCGAFLLNTMLFTLPRYLGMDPDFLLAGLFEWITLFFASLSMAVGGSYFIIRAARSLGAGVLHIDLPIAAGMIAAYAGSLYGFVVRSEAFLYFDFVSIFIFLMLVGRWTQEWAIEKNRNTLLALRPRSRTVTVIDPLDGRQRIRKPFHALMPGMLVEIEPGGQVPVFGRLRSPNGIFSLEWITGESQPCHRKIGQEVPAGAQFLGTQPVLLETRESWEDSLLARLTRESQEPPFRDPRAESILRWYILVVLVFSLAGALGWTFLLQDGIQGLQSAISLLVVSCPCALGIAFPMAHELAVSRLRRYGVFLREPGLWARLDAIRHVIFDKTGTLTYETPHLENPQVFLELGADYRQILYAMTEASLHPVSRAIRESLLAHYPELSEQRWSTDSLAESVGSGLECQVKGDRFRVGRPSWASQDPVTGLPDQTDCVFSRNGETLASFRISEAVREDAETEIRSLESRGYSVFILSGDRSEKVSQMATKLRLGPGRAIGEMSPDHKADWIRLHAPGSALMVGDGANDSLAFDAARATGTPALDRGFLEHKADFFFLGRGIHAIRRILLVHTIKKTAQRQVFLFAAGYNAATGILCLGGLMNPLLAAILMPASSLVTLAMVGLHFHSSSEGETPSTAPLSPGVAPTLQC